MLKNVIFAGSIQLEYNQKSLWYILDALAGGYDERQKEAMITNSTRYYLTGLQAELRVAINRLDAYIAERKKNDMENAGESAGETGGEA